MKLGLKLQSYRTLLNVVQMVRLSQAALGLYNKKVCISSLVYERYAQFRRL
jgi:hypothetical protein